MPYEVSWYQDKRIIFNRLAGAFEVENVMEASNKVSQHLSEGIAPIHLIVDMSELSAFPTNITKLNAMNAYLKNPSLGWVVVVGGNSLTKFLVNVISQIVKFRVAQRITVEQAVEFLQQQDKTLVAVVES